MTLRVPLTLTIIPALTLSIAGQNFAIPRSAIEEIVRANGESVTLEHVGGAGVATIRGRRVPEVSLAEILGLDSDDRGKGPHLDRTAARRRRRLRPVRRPHPRSRGAGGEAGRSGGHGDRPLCRNDACRRRQPDPAVRSRRASPQVGGVKLETQERSARIAEKPAAPSSHATTGPAVPRSRRRAAGRFASPSSTGSRKCPIGAVKEAAGQLRVQVGDAILPLAGASGAELGDDKVRLFRLNDGAHEIGYAFAEVIDFADDRQ